MEWILTHKKTAAIIAAVVVVVIVVVLQLTVGPDYMPRPVVTE